MSSGRPMELDESRLTTARGWNFHLFTTPATRAGRLAGPLLHGLSQQDQARHRTRRAAPVDHWGSCRPPLGFRQDNPKLDCRQGTTRDQAGRWAKCPVRIFLRGRGDAETATEEFDLLIELLESPLLDENRSADLERAVVQWQAVRRQIEELLSQRTSTEKFLGALRGS